jgi:hypothetical protein
MTPDFFYRPTPDQDPSSGYLVFNPSTAEDRCPGSERYVSIDSPRPSPDRSPCPECGKVISFHRVTGRFKHHNRSVTVPPSLPDLGPGSVIGIVGLQCRHYSRSPRRYGSWHDATCSPLAVIEGDSTERRQVCTVAYPVEETWPVFSADDVPDDDAIIMLRPNGTVWLWAPGR